MKKWTAFFLALILLLSFTGCSIWQESAADETYIMVRSAGVDTDPYVNFLWSHTYGEYGWLSADGIRISWELSQVCSQFPVVVYANDFEIRCQDGVTFQYLSVYNEEFQCIHQNVTQDILMTLPDGTYYLVITAKGQGAYILAENTFETYGYEFAYKLLVDSK